MKNLPNKIFLQVEDEIGDFNDLAEVTWCVDKINKTDVGYGLLGKDFNVPAMKKKQAELLSHINSIFDHYGISQVHRSKLHSLIRGVGMLKLRLL